MAVHALLGATGNLGSAILRCLLSSHGQIPDLRINILVRSKSKLLQAFPQLESTSSATITIFEGSISDEDTLKACINGASTIYVCVATNYASRNVDIAVTTAARLVAALGQLRNDRESEYSTPVVLFNRSMALNSDVQLPVPGFIKRFTVFAIWHIYEDLLKAGAVYAGAEKDGLLTCITADGPGLMGPNRTEATGYKLMERGKASAALNYADFGIAMVELGHRREEFGGKVVGISATGALGEIHNHLLK
ncbi:hypothetical protein BCR34DRAFT_655451 [Clohesyomyces aquaticus]|uniref:NmrA-like domain-containing protein n=1 Tax=Clohesyomyces aquaticus TaxID=1231657 RepID=A0A1Y1ZIT1_9PLEO|nr:hypothetical protein BCR34DRAFT_655451 [Clohesyomyces aquaticus]